MPTTAAIDRSAAIDWYRRNRIRSEQIFNLIDPSAYYTRPISLRNPIVFYEGHLPAFSVIAFLRRGLNRPAVDRQLEELFARGIDPDSEANAVPRSGASTEWPSRDQVRAFARRCDEAVLAALSDEEVLPLEGLYTALEHEAMHQETLLYMWHRLSYEQKSKPKELATKGARRTDQRPGTNQARRAWLPSAPGRITIGSGTALLGAQRHDVPFGWDNEFDAHRVAVDAFEIDTLPVTNAQYLEFVNADGYRARDLWSDEGWAMLQQDSIEHPIFWSRRNGAWFWRGMFEEIPLPADWPVYVSHAEASAFARWKGRRLMTEPEFHRAAYTDPSGAERDRSETPLGHFDFDGFEPVPAGSFPPSPWGVHDLIGNGWEWTSTIFGPFPGFTPMSSYPEYSADFFDGQHFVMKGASSATARELVRPSFRNWFRGNYPYVYAKFRTVA
jgi:gamma-glutamyl hercynylcysteine S-oxide synthase